MKKNIFKINRIDINLLMQLKLLINKITKKSFLFKKRYNH